ncbi:MAG: hypothetical protein WC947_07425 [Elusimicrobiota bacterium]
MTCDNQATLKGCPTLSKKRLALLEVAHRDTILLTGLVINRPLFLLQFFSFLVKYNYYVT